MREIDHLKITPDEVITWLVGSARGRIAGRDAGQAASRGSAT